MDVGIMGLSRRKIALATGTAILVMTAAAIVATDLTIGSLVVPGDPAVTTANITGSGMVFRIGVFSWLIILICDVLAAWGFYLFFKPVSGGLSLLAGWFRLMYAAILGAALSHYVAVLPLLGLDGSQAAMGMEGLQSRISLELAAFDDVWSAGLVVFGIHILVLGYLVVKSRDVPGVFGVLLILAFFGYFIINSANLLMPGHENFKKITELIFILPMIVGEVGLGVWFLVRGGKEAGY